MKRLYGVITGYTDPEQIPTNQTTASEFLDKLYAAGLDDGESKSAFDNPIQLISNYAYLNENMDNSVKAQMMSDLSRAGIIKEALNEAASAQVFSDLTKGSLGASQSGEPLPSEAEVAKFADNLYLAIIPAGVAYSWYTPSITRILIIQFYTEEVTTSQEVQQINEETGETETVEQATTETIVHKNEFMLGSNNSNANAPAVAYELTTVYSCDILVKLAWCTNDCPSTEEALKNVFSALSINDYVAKIEDAGYDYAKVVMGHSGKGHSDIVFGAGGPVGGFLLHTMRGQSNGSRHAITVFNADGTPLYTWSAGSKPWDQLDAEKERAANVNLGGLGRIITDEKYGDSSNSPPIIAMSALAPIFTPAIDDIADTAKWMPQGPYDYSYFDNSGHIVMTKGNSPNTVFFADHGLYLYDGEWGDGWSTDGLEVPDIAPSDLVNIERPVIPDELPYSTGMWAYFDCLAGLDANGWMNYRDASKDMLFTNGPVINEDGSAHFVNRYSNPITGMVTGGKWTGPKVSKNIYSCFFAVFKWTSNQTTPNNWQTFLLGMLFDKRTNAPSESPNNAALFPYRNAIYGSDTWTIDNNGDQFSNLGLQKDTWYIMVYYTRQNSTANVRLYNSNGVQVSEAREPNKTRPSNDVITNAAAVFCGDPIGRYYMDGYPYSTAKTILQGKKNYSPWDTAFPDISLEVSLDVKFFAAGVYDPNNEITDFDSKMTWCPGMANPGTRLSECVAYLKDRFFA